MGFTSGSLTPLRKIPIGESLAGAELTPGTADDGCPTEIAGVVPAATCFNVFKGFTRDMFIRVPDELPDVGVGGAFRGEIPTEGDVMPTVLLVGSEVRSNVPAGSSAASFAVFKGRDTFFGASGHRGFSSRCLSATPLDEGKIPGLP